MVNPIGALQEHVQAMAPGLGARPEECVLSFIKIVEPTYLPKKKLPRASQQDYIYAIVQRTERF